MLRAWTWSLKTVENNTLWHLCLKTPELYEGLKNVLDLQVSVTNKTHAEGVAESMGSFTQKRKGICIFQMFELKPLSTGMAHQLLILLLC